MVMYRFDGLFRCLARIAGPLLAAAAVAYFGYYGVWGDRGLLAWLTLNQNVEHTRTVLAMSRAEEQRLAHRVSLLRPDHLDRDMLDERSRTILNLIEADEIIIFAPPSGESR